MIHPLAQILKHSIFSHLFGCIDLIAFYSLPSIRLYILMRSIFYYLSIYTYLKAIHRLQSIRLHKSQSTFFIIYLFIWISSACTNVKVIYIMVGLSGVISALLVANF